MQTAEIVGLFVCGLLASAIAQTPEHEMLNRIPANSGEHYRCEDMIQTVNCLRRLGKERALGALRTYVNESAVVPHENVLLVCRVLFVNTNEWEVRLPGMPRPDVSTNAYVLFPLFPIAVSQGVPFELVEGYAGGGFFGNPAAACLKVCETLPLIPADLPQTNYEAAARALIRSRPFQLLYQHVEDRQRMAELILRQAGVSGEANRGSK